MSSEDEQQERQDLPSDDGNEGSSTERDSKSSQTQGLGSGDDLDIGTDDELGRFINGVLGPVVGKRFHAAVKGTLCFRPRQKIRSIDELGGLSLIDALHLDLSETITFTTAAAPASSEGSSPSSGSGRGGNGDASRGGQSSSRGSGSGGGW